MGDCRDTENESLNNLEMEMSPPIGLMRSQLTNHQVGIVLAVRAWSEKLYQTSRLGRKNRKLFATGVPIIPWIVFCNKAPPLLGSQHDPKLQQQIITKDNNWIDTLSMSMYGCNMFPEKYFYSIVFPFFPTVQCQAEIHGDCLVSC